MFNLKKPQQETSKAVPETQVCPFPKAQVTLKEKGS